MSKPMISLTLVLLTFAGAASAQSYNPRGNYANPDGNTTKVYKGRGPCGDPWVTIALINVYGRADPSKCNVSLYNGGRWGDFNQLVHAVAKQKSSGQASSLAGSAKPPPPRAGDLINRNSGRLVGQDGGTLIGNDGAGFRK